MVHYCPIMATVDDGPKMDARVARSRRAILAAALDELAEAGYPAFAMESVAARAGVGRSTLYRHWNDRATLVADALEELNVQPGPTPVDDADPRRCVEALLTHLCTAVTDSPVGRCLPALIHAAELDQAVRDFLHGYSARRRRALTEAVAALVGPDADADAVSAALSGAVFYRRLLTPDPWTPDQVAGLVDTVLGPRTGPGGVRAR